MLKIGRWMMGGGWWIIAKSSKSHISYLYKDCPCGSQIMPNNNTVILNSIQDPLAVIFNNAIDSGSGAGMTSFRCDFLVTSYYPLTTKNSVGKCLITFARYTHVSCITIALSFLYTFCTSFIRQFVHTFFNDFKSVNSYLSALYTGPITTTTCNVK